MAVADQYVVKKQPVPKPTNYYTEPQWIDIEGVPTAYRRKGTGETLVFLHGAGMTRMWTPFYEELSKSFDVIAPEHPGFGETPMPHWLRNFDDVVQHYHEFFRKLGLTKLNLVGYSLGGWIAAEYATFYPDSIASLTLITPAGLRGEKPADVDLFRVGPELGMYLFNDPAKAADVVPPDTLDEMAFLYGEGTTLARLMWTPRYNLALPRRLNRVTAPALVVRAADDRLIPDDIAVRYRRALPNSRDLVIPGTGHALVHEEPRLVAEAIGRFVKEHHA